MGEETKNTTALDGSAFARVLGRIMEARGIPATEDAAVELAERSGLDPETFRARLYAELGADPGDLSRLARELELTTPEMDAVATAYVYEEERVPEKQEAEKSATEGISRPEEVIQDLEERPEDISPRPLRCRFGSRAAEGGCPRDATGWLYPKDREIPVCDEHARVAELADEVQHWELALDVVGDWLKLARAWGHEDLERMATNCREEANEEALKAEARADLAREIADSPRKGRRERIAELTPEQDAKLARLILRSDALVTARTVLEDAPEVEEEVKRRTLGILVIEADRATEEAHRYSEELGIRPE